MKGLKPIETVKDLIQYLEACPPEAQVSLVPEDGEGFPIGGVLQFPAMGDSPCQVWVLIDGFSDSEDLEDSPVIWSGDDALERPGDMATALATEAPTPPVDAVKVRGKLRSA